MPANADADWQIVHKLIAQSQLTEAEYKGRKFYIRNLKHN
jgi:hypothetical protein